MASGSDPRKRGGGWEGGKEMSSRDKKFFTGEVGGTILLSPPESLAQG